MSCPVWRNWEVAEGEGKVPETNLPFCHWLPLQRCHSGGKNGILKLCQLIPKTTSEKKREKKRRNQLLYLHKATLLTLILYGWLVILKLYRWQVWHWSITTDEWPLVSHPLAFCCCCYLTCIREEMGGRLFGCCILAAETGKKPPDYWHTVRSVVTSAHVKNTPIWVYYFTLPLREF